MIHHKKIRVAVTFSVAYYEHLLKVQKMFRRPNGAEPSISELNENAGWKQYQDPIEIKREQCKQAAKVFERLRAELVQMQEEVTEKKPAFPVQKSQIAEEETEEIPVESEEEEEHGEE